MDQKGLKSADYWRQRADRARLCAAESVGDEIRASLLGIAIIYDSMGRPRRSARSPGNSEQGGHGRSRAKHSTGFRSQMPLKSVALGSEWRGSCIMKRLTKG